MASFTVRVDDESGITHIDFFGNVSIPEVAEFMQGPEFAKRTNKVIFDCRKASFVAIPSEEILAGVRELKSQVIPGNKAAYVCEDGVEFGIANMFKNYSQVSDYRSPVEVFTSMEDAIDWINRD